MTDFQQEFLSLRQAVLAQRSPGLAAPAPEPIALSHSHFCLRGPRSRPPLPLARMREADASGTLDYGQHGVVHREITRRKRVPLGRHRRRVLRLPRPLARRTVGCQRHALKRPGRVPPPLPLAGMRVHARPGTHPRGDRPGDGAWSRVELPPQTPPPLTRTRARTRYPPQPGLVHHSDQGLQYVSLRFGERCREIGIHRSVGSKGDCFDNAVAESFFATLEKDLLRRRSFATRQEARTAVFDYIELFYNPIRLHSTLGYLSPVEYEKIRKEEKAA